MPSRSVSPFWRSLFAKPGQALAVALGLPALLAGQAQANDGVASMAGGGLSFGKSDIVRMQSETLTIDLDEPRIHLRYEFVNPSPDPQDLTVAFPLPLIPLEAFLGYGDSPVLIEDFDSDPYVDFNTTINEQDHPTQRVLELMWNGEVLATKALKSGEAYAAAAKQLYADHAPVADGEDPWANVTKPALTGIRLTYLWQYTFYTTNYEDALPITVEHSYTPVLGGFVEAILDPMQYEWEDPSAQPSSAEEQEEWYGSHRRERCLDAPRNHEQVLQVMGFKRERPKDGDIFPRS